MHCNLLPFHRITILYVITFVTTSFTNHPRIPYQYWAKCLLEVHYRHGLLLPGLSGVIRAFIQEFKGRGRTHEANST